MGSWGSGMSSRQSPSPCVWKRTGLVGSGQHRHSGVSPHMGLSTTQPPRSRPALTEAPETRLRPAGAKLCQGEPGGGGGQPGGLLRSRHRQQGPPQIPDTRLFFHFPPTDSEESGMASGRKTCSVTSQMDRASPQGCTEVKALSLQGKTEQHFRAQRPARRLF